MVKVEKRKILLFVTASSSGRNFSDVQLAEPPCRGRHDSSTETCLTALSFFLCRLGTVAVSGKSNWELLDSLIHRLFKEYLMRIDPIGNLGLGADSIEFYQVSSRPNN